MIPYYYEISSSSFRKGNQELEINQPPYGKEREMEPKEEKESKLEFLKRLSIEIDNLLWENGFHSLDELENQIEELRKRE